MITLAECTFREAAQLAHDPRSLVLLPLGAIEQHGPHLPLLVDWLGAEELARRIAPHLTRAGYRPVLAPALPYGVSTRAVTWGGTVSLSRRTLKGVIVEIVHPGLPSRPRSPRLQLPFPGSCLSIVFSERCAGGCHATWPSSQAVFFGAARPEGL